ncbi:hypothetical protein [Chroococcidiopsis sp. CCMEE 29]|uniref:hypothetical protein n=1 Tax=Chroococcidiopsis sp. CCMEE 29 TaxID=155894 RepID=UPI002021DB59|nr:hypothetical protein [Chroococcidiopsis sp. CCMEE 29]
MPANITAKMALIKLNADSVDPVVDTVTGQTLANAASQTDATRRAAMKARIATTFESRRRNSAG